MTPPRPSRDAGFTLIEIVVALAIFALVAAAGGTLVTTILDARRHTDGRLERIADLERTLAVIGRDFDEIADAPLTGSSAAVALDRHDGSLESGISYRLAGGRLERIRAGQPQRLLDQVVAVRWRYLGTATGWQDHWPADDAQAHTWPAAIAIDLDLAGAPPIGHVRRVVDLPVRPLPPGAVTQ